MRAFAMLFGLLLATPASAARHEVSIEMGLLQLPYDSFDLYSNEDVVPTFGIRGGPAVYTKGPVGVAVLAGWHRFRRGSTTWTYDADDYQETSFRAAFMGDVFTLGAKVDVPLWGWFNPYVHAGAVLARGESRLDDDPDHNDNAGQQKSAGVAPGFMAMGGLEFDVPPGDDKKVAVALYHELGYTWIAPIPLGELGSVKPEGFTMRLGVGLRF